MIAQEKVFVGLGSNLGDSITQLQQAMTRLRHLPGCQWRQRSSFYTSAPVGNLNQPDFVNAVCELSTSLSAPALMQALLKIEADLGRVRDGTVAGPRTLDLDLLLYGQMQLSLTEVVVPHPRMPERAFVLYPLLEIAPEIEIPGRGRAADFLSGCQGQVIERLPEPVLVDNE